MVTSQECLQYLRTGAVSKGDADISGKGVILAFLISAYTSFAAVLVAYLTGMVENELLASVDRKIFRIKSRTSQHPRIHETIRHVVLLLSDQQIVTGIAIMAAGFLGLHSGKMSVYHYQIVLYLAWLSSSVHLSALTLLRPFLNDHHGLRAWRLLGMIVLFVMLLVGLVPTISYDWGIIYSPDADTSLPDSIQPTGWGVPAICFWGKTYHDGVNNDAPIGYLILVLSYVWKAGDLFLWPRQLYHHKVRRPIEKCIASLLSVAARRYARRRNTGWLWCFRISLMACIPLLAFMEVLASFSASLWLSVLGLVFGTIQIVVPRQQNLAQTAHEETEWGFGQLVPLILLIQPVGAISEHAWIKPGRSHAEGHSHRLNSHVSPKPIDYRSPSQHSETELQIEEPFSHPVPGRSIVEVFGQRQRLRDGFAETISDWSTLKTTILASRLFALVVLILQITILGAACVILTFDAQSVGYQRGENWFYVLVAIGSYAAVSWLVLLVFGPFSRLGRALS
ncbi:hypothetical protein QM012_005487 [Aureobasidium pullulans]|uniref:Amino acid transporter n=1 Tax=Aureobasidium pullulans TaxID=5580 RepID=A0ABR0T5G9_AURPU